MSLAYSPRTEKRASVSPDIFKPVFDALAVDGAIGDPQGIPAYAYMRVSSKGQAEEGRSGIPRQIEHIHEAAQRAGYRVSWDMVFADDASGFEYLSRPALTRLRKEYPTPRARAVIIESIDRLSRKMSHQETLLDQMTENGIKSIFWKAFSGPIEQAVMAAVAQEAMVQAKANMLAGTIKKAESGRITAKFASYGYKLVDSQGREHGANVRKDTHYAIVESEAAIVRFMYERYAMGISLLKLRQELIARGVTLCHSSAVHKTTLRKILMNPVYKGEFVTNRTRQVVRYERQKDGSMNKIKSRETRPPEEWIVVPVPPIVSPDLWQAAQERFARNQNCNSGRDDRKYLLTGLIVCSSCGFKYSGKRHSTKHGKTPFYVCGKREASRDCHQPGITASRLEAAVWAAVTDTLLRPEMIVAGLEEQYRGDHNRDIANQIDHVKSQINRAEALREDDRQDYLNGKIDLGEYKHRRAQNEATIRQLEADIAELQRHLITPEQFETKKQQVLALAAQVRKLGAQGLSLKLKRDFLMMVIDRIVLDVKGGKFTIEGALPGVYSLSSNQFTTDCGSELLNIPFIAQYNLKSNTLLSLKLA